MPLTLSSPKTKMMITGNNFDLRQNVKAQLTAAGIESAAFEAKQLTDAFCSNPQKLEDAVMRRINGEPLQYILGEWEFYGITLKTDSRALIPRADTETLAQAALDFLKGKDKADIIDLCSGTGCIALALAKHSGFSVTALEKFNDAYTLLCENIKLCNLPVNAVCADLFDGPNGRKYDLIVSNPPYIKADDIKGLQKEVGFEPKSALDGGTDGLCFYRAIAKLWVPSLNSGGMLAVEIGMDQHEDVKALFEAAGLKSVRFYKDLSGIIRVVSGIKKANSEE